MGKTVDMYTIDPAIGFDVPMLFPYKPLARSTRKYNYNPRIDLQAIANQRWSDLIL